MNLRISPSPIVLIFAFFQIFLSCNTKSNKPIETPLVIYEDSLTGVAKAKEARENIAAQLADGLQLSLWASDSLAPDPIAMDAYQLWLDGGPRGMRLPPDYLGPFNYLREFVQMTDFLAAWQVLDPASDDYGGMIEAESGALGGVIQTDNTLEAIWCWSRFKEFSGRSTDDGGHRLGSGVYFCRIRIGDESQTVKIVMAK